MKSIKHYLVGICFLTVGVATITGCGGGGSSGGDSGTTARATVMLSNQGAVSSNLVARAGNGGGPVSADEIESLTVSVTEVSLFRKTDDDDDDDDDLVTIRVLDFEFDPNCATVEEGGTVRWVWETDTLHTITSGSPGEMDEGSLFDESASGTGAVVELIFEDKGFYPYFSNTEMDILEGMAGSIKVVKDDDDDDDRRSGGHGGGGDDDDEGELITVFEGLFDLNLVDPSALSEVLTMADIPPGEYRKIVLQIENPRLVLVEDPDTIITNVKLTANGRLFIKDKFEVGEDDEVIIDVQFVGFHLVKAGNSGKYVLTPKVRAEIDVQDANVMFTGVIVEPPDGMRGEGEAMIVWVQRDDGGDPVQVFVDEGTIIETDDDSDDAARGVVETDPTVPLEFADLAVGQGVEVTGLLTFGGQVMADIIVVNDEDFDTEAPVEEAV